MAMRRGPELERFRFPLRVSRAHHKGHNGHNGPISKAFVSLVSIVVTT